MHPDSMHHRLKIGSINITALSDGRMPMPMERLFPETPREVWEGYRERFPEAFDASGFLINLGSFLVRSGDRLVLVDTGLGPYSTWPTLWPDATGARFGPAELIAELRTKGVQPEEIDTVFLTHLHGDHLGWNLTRSGDRWTPTFPRARYLLQRADWQAFTRPEFLDSGRREAAERNYLPLLLQPIEKGLLNTRSPFILWLRSGIANQRSLHSGQRTVAEVCRHVPVYVHRGSG